MNLSVFFSLVWCRCLTRGEILGGGEEEEDLRSRGRRLLGLLSVLPLRGR